jgi:hypothetical protein
MSAAPTPAIAAMIHLAVAWIWSLAALIRSLD